MGFKARALSSGFHQSCKTRGAARAFPQLAMALKTSDHLQWSTRRALVWSGMSTTGTGVLKKPFLLAPPLLRLCEGPSDQVQPAFREEKGGARVLLRKFLADLFHVKDRIEILCTRCVEHLIVSYRLRILGFWTGHCLSTDGEYFIA